MPCNCDHLEPSMKEIELSKCPLPDTPFTKAEWIKLNSTEETEELKDLIRFLANYWAEVNSWLFELGMKTGTVAKVNDLFADFPNIDYPFDKLKLLKIALQVRNDKGVSKAVERMLRDG